jgi:hypothetical protein
VVRAYFARREIPAPGRSAYELLVYLQAVPDMPARVREAARQLAMRVNEDFALPSEADLIEEARQLARGLDAKLDELEKSSIFKNANSLGGE